MSSPLAVGMGCRIDASPESIAALVAETLGGCSGTAKAIYTHEEKSLAENVRHAAQVLGLALVGVSAERLAEQAPYLTHASEAAKRRFGVASVAEAAALAGAGPGATLLAFAKTREVTCAIAAPRVA